MISPGQVIIVPRLHVNGMALFPFLLVKKKELLMNNVFVNHELIHFRQQIELLIVPFYILYLLNYCLNLLLYGNHHLAYRNIIFEREAYARENDFNYLRNRSWGSFMRYSANV